MKFPKEIKTNEERLEWLRSPDYKLVAVKRGWCPDWLFYLVSPIVKYQPFRTIFTRKP